MMIPDQRAYNMILTKRSFGNPNNLTTYALLGFENGKTWNLLGGKQDNSDGDSKVAAARELYEESGKFFDKRNDLCYWNNLPRYSYTKHLIFIHPPGNLDCNIEKLNKATKLCIADKSLSHDYKEMHRYQIVKLTDLIELANQPFVKGESMYYNHPTEPNPMKIDGWVLFSLKNADKSELLHYV